MAFELAQLNRLLEVYRLALDEFRETPPRGLELPGTTALMHSFYNGIENIFKRIALDLDGSVPQGEDWHQKLLVSMTKPTQHRPAVISETLFFRLLDYLTFRHMFRYAYTFRLEWEKMSTLVLNSPQTLRLLEAELNEFLAGLP